MANRITKENYSSDKLIIKTEKEELITIEAGQGTIERGQALAMDNITGKYKKYNPAGADGTEKFSRVALAEVDTTEEVKVNAANGRFNKDEIKGIELTDYKGIKTAETFNIYLETVNTSAY